MNVLDIGTGKDWTKWIESIEDKTVRTVTCVDSGYTGNDAPRQPYGFKFVGTDIFQFLEGKIHRNYDFIFAERVFEHIPYDKLSYLLYLLYECSIEKTELVIIVPDFAKVGKSIDGEFTNVANAKLFNKWLIDIHTETFNEPSDPHQSIWTPQLGTYYIELEGYWKVKTIREVERDNRSWYTEFRAISTRPKTDINDIIAPVEGDFNEVC